MIFSNESLFSLFPTTDRVYVLRQPKEALHPDCFLSNCEKWRGFCDDLGRYFLEIPRSNDFLHGRINKRDHLQILKDQVHPMAQTLLPEGNAIFQDDDAPIHTARIVKE